MNLPNFTATDICLIIAAIGGVITSTIAALKANKADKNVTAVHLETSSKLNDIHEQVNGNLSQIKEELKYHQAIANELRKNYDSLYQDAKEQVDKRFADRTRRYSDSTTGE